MMMLEEVIYWNLKLLVSNQKDKEVTTIITPFSMKQVMNRFDNKKEEPFISELRSEVNILKEEIREVKYRLHKIEEKP